MRYCTILRSCDSCPTTMRAASRQAMQSQTASTLTTVRLRNFWTPLRLGIHICRLFHCQCLSKPVLPMASSSCTSCLCGGHRKVEKQRSLRLKMGWSRKCYDNNCMLQWLQWLLNLSAINVALICWTLQLRLYLFSSTQQHQPPKTVSPK